MYDEKLTRSEHAKKAFKENLDMAQELKWEWFHYIFDSEKTKIDIVGTVTQAQLFAMFPEIHTRFFLNFNVEKLEVATGSGKALVFLRKENTDGK